MAKIEQTQLAKTLKDDYPNIKSLTSAMLSKVRQALGHADWTNTQVPDTQIAELRRTFKKVDNGASLDDAIAQTLAELGRSQKQEENQTPPEAPQDTEPGEGCEAGNIVQATADVAQGLIKSAAEQGATVGRGASTAFIVNATKQFESDLKEISAGMSGVNEAMNKAAHVEVIPDATRQGKALPLAHKPPKLLGA